MTFKEVLKSDKCLSEMLSTVGEVSKSIHTPEGQYNVVCDYWEAKVDGRGNVIRPGFRSAVAKYDIAKPSELWNRLFGEEHTLHPMLYTTDKGGNACLGVPAERPVIDETKLIKDRSGKLVYAYKLDKNKNVIKESYIRPIIRYNERTFFELLAWDMYLKAREKVASELESATAIAESQGISIDALIDNVTKTVVTRVEKKNEDSVAKRQEESKQKRQKKGGK